MAETFLSKYTVTIGDINYGGHLGNERALVVFQDARISFLESFGYSEMDIGDNRGIIMVESGVRYHREIFLHQQLEIGISISQLTNKKLSMDYQVFRGPSHEQVLSGFTLFLSFDYTSRKVSSFPEDFRNKLEPYFVGKIR